MSRGEGVHKILSKSNSPKAGDLRPHEQRPRKTDKYSQQFKTEDWMGTLVEICRLSRCYVGKHVRWDCPRTTRTGSGRSSVIRPKKKKGHANHNASNTGLHRQAAGDLCRRCENSHLTRTRQITPVNIRKDHTRDGEEAHISCKYHGRL